MNPAPGRAQETSGELLRGILAETQQLKKVQAATNIYLFGSTLVNGENADITIEPTKDSFCGRLADLPATVNRNMALWLTAIGAIIGMLTYLGKVK